MARNDLLISLIKAGATGDRTLLRSTVEALVAEERARNHTILAERLLKAIAGMGNGRETQGAKAFAARSQPGRDAVIEIRPQRTLEELVLPSKVRTQVDGLIEEQLRADRLRAAGLQPRHRVLLAGPPGNGKTTLAEAIAERLGISFFVVRYDSVIASLLGETNTRLKNLFDYARTIPSVLFFDEFDTLGKERGDPHETGEIKRVVSNLLLQIDALPSYVVTVVATNHAELLDRAVWRRFELRLSLPQPTRTELAQFLDGAFAKWPERPGIDGKAVAAQLHPLSYAEATDFCHDIRRRYVLEDGARKLTEIVSHELLLWRDRLMPESDAVRSDQASAPLRSARRRAADDGRAADVALSDQLPKSKARAKARAKVRPARTRHRPRGKRRNPSRRSNRARP